MKFEILQQNIGTVLDWKKKKLLTVNEEYQRGAVWSQRQEKLLIDSILRGYPIPFFYFHFIRNVAPGLSSESFEIIDGQQRLNAIENFSNNKFKLFDPKKERITGLPKFLAEQPCEWGGKTFDSLPDELRKSFLSTSLQIAKIESENVNEVRELFVRLQAGLPLNSQEKRDAWPGDFSQFIIRTAGKHPLRIGHDFFSPRCLKVYDPKRGGTRQACAQMFMTFYNRREHGPYAFVEFSSPQLDEFYRHHLDFSSSVPGYHVERFNKILDILTRVITSKKRPPVRFHIAFHSILLVDALLDDFTPEWQVSLSRALDTFSARLAQATIESRKKLGSPGEYWTRYGALARTNSTSKSSIMIRHDFFVKEMTALLAPLNRKDPKRVFSLSERELLFFKSGQICAICGGNVDWIDAEAHHVTAHSQGGITSLENAALVHAKCHPRGPVGPKDTREFNVTSEIEVPGNEAGKKRINLDDLHRAGILENGAEFRFKVRERTHKANYVAGKGLIYSIGGTEHIAQSPSKALTHLTGVSRDGWRDWLVRQDGRVEFLNDLRERYQSILASEDNGAEDFED